MKKALSALLAVVVAAGALVGLDATTSPDTASALSGSDFDPGYIISDQVFYDGGRMGEAQIQAFLDAQIGSCANGACLNVLRVDTTNRPGDAVCGAYQGAAGESVARILAKVGAACGINPQVLLVTLQKEQSLVSGSTARQPSAARLERAMGYACPDNVGGACDPTYAGVYNQLYRAAWQFKRYGNPPGTSEYFTQYRPGATHAVLYNPNRACGTQSVAVRNAATAALYYYTPYVPNAAALSNLFGTGDSCSAYGNRNFWVYFNQWFGAPTGEARPLGALDSVAAGVESVSVRGWALDQVSSASIDVRVYVGATPTVLRADRSRPDVAAAHPGKGASHGFEATFAAPAGRHDVCVFAVAPYENITGLGCRTVDVASSSPVGSLDTAVAVPGGVAVRGWAHDAETRAPIGVDVYAGGRGTNLRADQSRPDVARALATAGQAHGFSATVPSRTGGNQSVCAYGINVGRGANALVGCADVVVPSDAPTGALDSVTTSPAGLTVRGWALDGDTTASIPVHVYVDGRARAVTADRARSDVGRVYPGYGSARGFELTVPAAPGQHSVCAYGINTGGTGTNTTLGCTSVTVTNRPPVGSLDGAAGVSGGISLRGWAWDPDSAALVDVHAYVDGRATSLPTGATRNDVAGAWPGSGRQRGFEQVVPAARGAREVCVYAIDTDSGPNPLLGCRTVVVP